MEKEIKYLQIRHATAANPLFKPSNLYTWHHVEDGMHMMLVPKDLHDAVRHTGGAALLKHGLVPK